MLIMSRTVTLSDDHHWILCQSFSTTQQLNLYCNKKDCESKKYTGGLIYGSVHLPPLSLIKQGHFFRVCFKDFGEVLEVLEGSFR